MSCCRDTWPCNGCCCDQGCGGCRQEGAVDVGSVVFTGTGLLYILRNVKRRDVCHSGWGILKTQRWYRRIPFPKSSHSESQRVVTSSVCSFSTRPEDKEVVRALKIILLPSSSHIHTMFRAVMTRQTTMTLLRPRLQQISVRGNATSSANAAKDTASKAAETAQARATEALGSAQKTAEKAFGQVQGLTGKLGAVVGDLLGGV